MEEQKNNNIGKIRKRVNEEEKVHRLTNGKKN